MQRISVAVPGVIKPIAFALLAVLLIEVLLPVVLAAEAGTG